MGNIFQKKEKIGTCGLCETSNIPMKSNLFCKYCYQFYFENPTGSERQSDFEKV